MNEMLRFMLKPDKRTHGCMHKQTHVWKAFTISRPQPLLFIVSQTRIAKLKSAYNFLIIQPRGLHYEKSHTKSWGRNLLMLDLTFGPSFKVKQWFTAGGYIFASVLRCVGPVLSRYHEIITYFKDSKLFPQESKSSPEDTDSILQVSKLLTQKVVSC